MVARSSLSKLRFALVGVSSAVLLSCGGPSGGGGAGSGGFGGQLSGLEDFIEFACDCLVMAGQYPDVNTCQQSEYSGLGLDGIDTACLDAALPMHPEVQESYTCQFAANDRYYACLEAQGCSALGDGDGDGGGDDFMCEDGSSIPSSWQCDGEADCSNGEDEAGCPPSCDSTYNMEIMECTEASDAAEAAFETATESCYSYPCEGGGNYNAAQECDGVNDCPGGDDESNCPYTCPNGEEIPGEWVCDGYDDCGDNADEVDCGSP